MSPDYFDWKTGKVCYWGLHDLDPRRSLREQVRDLKEDLAQVEYSGEVILDIGWHPEFDPNGAFLILVVQHENWEAPRCRMKGRNMEELYAAIIEAVRVAEQLKG